MAALVLIVTALVLFAATWWQVRGENRRESERTWR
jgi:hypothetical protein